MTEITEEQRKTIIEEYLKNSAAEAEANAKKEAEEQTRNKKGQFGPKASDSKPSEPPASPAKDENTESRDALLDTIEKDFKESLKGHAILNELDGLDQRTRIRMLRAIANTKGEKPRGEGADPSNTPPLIATEPKTLSELNNMKDYLHDVQQRTSMFNITNKLRGKT